MRGRHSDACRGRDLAASPRRSAMPLRAVPRRSRRSTALLRRSRSLAAAMAGCGSSHPSGTAADPAGAVPASAPALRRRDRAPRRLPEGGRARRRADAHPPGRPLPAPARRAADAGLAAARLQPRRRALAGAAGRDLPQLAERRSSSEHQPAARAARSRACSAAPRPRAPSRSAPRASQGAIVLDTSDAAQGPLVPRLPGRARRRARRDLSRGRLPGHARAASPSALVDRFAVIGSESGAAQRDRHDARRPLAGARAPATRSSSPRPRREPSPTSTRTRASSPDASGSAAAAERAGHCPALLLRSLAGARESNISLVPVRHLDRARRRRPAPPRRRRRRRAARRPARKARGRSANCRANPGSRSASATSGATLGEDVQGLRSLRLARHARSAARARRHVVGGARASRACSKGSSRR